jgi:hypothetical protein
MQALRPHILPCMQAHLRELATGPSSAQPTDPLLLASHPSALGPHDIQPMPLLLLKTNSRRKAPLVLLTAAAVRHVWGLDIAGQRPMGEAPPAPVATRVVLQLDSGAGDGLAGGDGSGGGGEAQPPMQGGPFLAELQFVLKVHDKGGSERTYLQARLCGPELQRAVVGLGRVGLRRLDAGTVALVVARPPGYRPLEVPPVRAAWVGTGSFRAGFGMHVWHTILSLI